MHFNKAFFSLSFAAFISDEKVLAVKNYFFNFFVFAEEEKFVYFQSARRDLSLQDETQATYNFNFCIVPLPPPNTPLYAELKNETAPTGEV